MLVLTAVTALGAVHAGLSGLSLRDFILVLLGGLTMPVVLFRIFLVKSGRVGDWDIHTRRERIGPLLALICVTLAAWWLTGRFGSPGLQWLFAVYAVWIFGFFMITLREKISGHVGITALAVGLLVKWYGWGWWPVLLLPVIVGWARVVRKDHTLRQAVLGGGYSLFILLLDQFV